MINILKSKISPLLCIALIASLPMMSFAASLESNMKTLAGQFKLFNQTEQPAQAIDALEQMKKAALDAKNSTPEKLKKMGQESKEFRAYQAELDQLVGAIEETQKLVNEGHLDHAKMQAETILKIKKEGHDFYK